MMKLVHVRIESIKISNFMPSSKTISFDIAYNNGSPKTIRLDYVISDLKDTAHYLIKDIRKREKKDNYEFEGMKRFDSYINVIIDDEDAAYEKIEGFLAKLHKKVNEIADLKTSDSYLSKINEIRMMSFRL